MDQALNATLDGWTNFYLITGGAAAALTGLQFVVQTLIATDLRPAAASDPELGIAAFGTPTVVHFTFALIASAAMCVPWPSHDVLRLVFGAMGVGAFIYALIVLQRTRRVSTYRPVFEDWLWHVVLPMVAYGAVLLAAVLPIDDAATWPYFVMAAVTIALLCIGIHNAWDSVTYMTISVVRREHRERGEQRAPTPAPKPTPASKRRRR